MFSHFLPPPQHPPLVGPSFLFLFLPQRGFFFFSFGATLLLELQAWRLLFFFLPLSSFLPPSSFLISLKGFCLLWEFRLKIESRLFPSFLSPSPSFFPSSQQKRGTKINKRGRRERQTSNGNGGLSLPGTKGARENSPPKKPGVSYPKEEPLGWESGGVPRSPVLPKCG